MTFTGRIRLYLVLIAVIPPLLILAAVWYESNAYNQRWRQTTVTQQISTFSFLLAQREENISRLLKDNAAAYDWLKFTAGTSRRTRITPPSELIGGGLDFLELIDSSGKVLWSRGRPELVGDQIAIPRDSQRTPTPFLTKIEIDHDGHHAAISTWLDIDSSVRLYGGTYLDNQFLSLLVTLMDATVDLHYFDTDPVNQALARLKPRELYEQDGDLMAVLMGGAESGFFLTATYSPEQRLPQFLTLYIVAIVVGLFAIGFAVALAWSLARRADLELNNLLAATERVARGDLQTPLFAYDTGEFSRLADGLSDMIAKLRRSQERLSATERIAAWQVMGRKIAHEIKNPLTPISISTDDLRRSYSEGRADFGNILTECTTTIRTEITRMTRLLDQFVAFARMPAPVMATVELGSIVKEIQSLYRAEIESGKLEIRVETTRRSLLCDPEQIKQLLINLIKNGREASDGKVVIRLLDSDKAVQIVVEDTGPGFSPEKLSNPFEPYVSTKKDGSGLGLVICQRIAIDHGGTIELYNRNEGGAGVRVVLPQA